MADLLENLNERQREAVLETEGYVRVIAGAGSGKTKLLVSRFAYLVQDYGIDSANILCVTFTNKAAGEMKRRIRGLIGDEHAASLVCTYHGFCNRLLRENPEKLFLNKQFQIIDSYQQKAVLGEIYQKFELKLDYASFEAILRKMGRVKKDLGYVTRMCNPRPCQIMEQIKNQEDKIIEEFLQRQKATYSLDFHDLIAFAVYLLQTDADVREKWQSRLNYIMVDEFQDSSKMEMLLVELLSGQFRNLMIVGDPDQNIYEWRGSDVKLLVDFDKEHEPTKTIILNQNYRSTPQILQCANTLIQKNELRLKKDLFTRNGAGAPVVHYHSKDDLEEMDRVIENIRQLREKEGYGYSDFAIIYRSGFLSRVAEKKLVEKNIPYEIFGGVRFYQRMEILDILAYLKLIAYDDDMSFKRIANTPRRRFGRAKMAALEALREQSGGTLFAAVSRHLEVKEFANSDIGSLVHMVEETRASLKERRISEIVNEVTLRSGYESYIRELGDEERLDNLAEFKRIANEFEREFGENLNLEQFLQQIALQSGEDEEKEKEAVKLMTIHSSKGLEFPVVFILGFTEGVFPSAKTIGDRKMLGLEEERRLCYVAITRAEKHLFLMESEGATPNGGKKLLSRFLAEIGENNYLRIGRISDALRQESQGYTAKLNGEMQAEAVKDLEVGDVVEHHVFGKGVIESIDKKRGSYSVRFEKLNQVRNLSASYFAKKHTDIRNIENSDSNKTECEMSSGERQDVAAEPAVRETEALKAAAQETAKQEQEPVQESQKGYEQESAESYAAEKKEAPAVEDRQPGQPELAPTGKDWMPGAAEQQMVSAGENWMPEQPELELDPVGESWKPKQPNPSDPPEDEEETEEIEDEGTTARSMSQPMSEQLKALKEDSPNLWKDSRVPKNGWNCVGVEDLGEPVGICQMCGYQIIRYAHQMEHLEYRSLSVGCVCAGKMEGDIAGAKHREAVFKSKQKRRMNFLSGSGSGLRRGMST